MAFPLECESKPHNKSEGGAIRKSPLFFLAGGVRESLGFQHQML